MIAVPGQTRDLTFMRTFTRPVNVLKASFQIQHLATSFSRTAFMLKMTLTIIQYSHFGFILPAKAMKRLFLRSATVESMLKLLITTFREG